LPRLPARFLLALAVVFPAASFAQREVTEPQSFPAERLRISTNRQGLIDVEDATVAPHLTWDAGLWMGYARNPLLVYRTEDNARLGPLVESRLGAAVVASVGLYDRFEVGLDLPVILYQGSRGPRWRPCPPPARGTSGCWANGKYSARGTTGSTWRSCRR